MKSKEAALTIDSQARTVRRACEPNWRRLFEESEDAQVICDARGEIAAANRKAAQLLGFDPAATLAPSLVFDFLTAPTGGKLADWLRAGLKHPQAANGVSLVTEGQERHLIDLRAAPLDDGLCLLTLRDASRRWRMESHVQRLLTAVDATPDLVFLADAEFRLTFVNASFQIVTGYSIEDALGRPSDFLRAPNQADKIQEYLQCVGQGRDWQGELINLRSSGTTYPVESSISPIFDKDGGLLGYAAFERDITQKKKLQDELRLERNVVVSILHSLDSAVYTLDREFRLRHVNAAWKKMPPQHGWLALNEPPEPGRPLLDYVDTDEHRSELAQVFARVLEDGQPQEIRTAPSKDRHWLITIAPWQSDGEVRGLIYVVTDHTKFHELQSQLFQAQKMETIGALAAGVAHDFNNLLQAIRGNVSLLLLDEKISENTRVRLDRIDQAATRSAAITQQLLSFSRASDEKETVLDFNQVLHEAAELAKRSLMSKVELKIVAAASPVNVRMDATRAHQLLLNLCVNAQDAMPDGGQLVLSNTRIALTAEQATKAHTVVGATFVRCSVSDTGTGIPPEILARIFDPFFTTKAKGKGTGLGLSIVHSVVAQAGGFLEVESTPGRGTTFHIHLPCVEDSLTAQKPAGSSPMHQGTGRVLVVDDLDLVQEFTRTFLKAAGYDVLVASNAEEAVAVLAAESQPVDVHEPKGDPTVCIPEHDVCLRVVIEITCADNFPILLKRQRNFPGDDSRAIHEPERE
ncbi:MAG: PAS domain-containing protein [Verrucomicrobia bacterium]|nr:PAS domain-containing protein [Verrucomicrobiota bacterium]